MESPSRLNAVSFGALRERLRANVNTRINNGEFTERGFAKLLGISQPQMHNVLKGARTLTPELSDEILARLGMSLLDLATDQELLARHGDPGAPIPKKPPSSLPPPGGELKKYAG